MVNESKVIKLEKEKIKLRAKYKMVMKIANIFGVKKLLKRMNEIDQEILYLVKTDEQEMNVLREYDKIEFLQREIKAMQREKQGNQNEIIAKQEEKRNQEMLVKKLAKNINFRKQTCNDNEVDSTNEENTNFLF